LFVGEAESEAALPLVTTSQQAQISALDVSGHDAYRRTTAYMRRDAAERGGGRAGAAERVGNTACRFCCKSALRRERFSAGNREARNNKRED
jgi:hypothetical protein